MNKLVYPILLVALLISSKDSVANKEPLFPGTPVITVTAGSCSSNKLQGRTARYKAKLYCIEQCPEGDAFIDCAKENINKFNAKKEEIHRDRCSVSISRTAEIYDNCIIDKLAPNANSTLRRSVRTACERISCNPSIFEKMKY